MSVNRLWKNLSLLTIAIGFAQMAYGDEATYQLVYKFERGQFLHYEVNDHAEITTQFAMSKERDAKSLAANQSKSVQRTRLLKSFRIVAVDEQGIAIIEPVIEQAKMSSTVGESQTITFDSAADTAPPKEFEMVASTIGHPLARFHIASNGRLVKVNLVVKDVPKKFSDAAEKTDPTINFLVVFPEKPVKIGEKWNEKYETMVNVAKGLNQPIKLLKVYELVSVIDDVATIKYRTSLLVPMDDTDILRQIATQTPSGTIEFDLKEGRIISRSVLIDEKVIGAFGAQTLLQALGESTEKLLR